jgi:hypothetical protein
MAYTLHQTIKDAITIKEAVDGGEAFDKFDELYLKNHRDSISKLQSGADKSTLQQDPNKAEEIYRFWDMHRKQIASRLKESLNEDRRGYGGWLSPSGKEYSVISAQAHENVAQNILGDEWEELKDQGIDASGILGMRGWARLVHQPNQTLVDMDTNSRLSSRQLSYLKDLGIENQIDVFLDVGMGRYLYKAGE